MTHLCSTLCITPYTIQSFNQEGTTRVEDVSGSANLRRGSNSRPAITNRVLNHMAVTKSSMVDPNPGPRLGIFRI